MDSLVSIVTDFFIFTVLLVCTVTDIFCTLLLITDQGYGVF